MRKFLVLCIAALAVYLSCGTEIAVSQSTTATAQSPVVEPPAGTPSGAVAAVSAVGTVLSGVDTSVLPSWVPKAIVIAFSTQGVLLLLSTGLMKLGTATKNSTETKIGTTIGQVAWGLGSVLSHIGGQKPTPTAQPPQQPPTTNG